MLGLSAAELSRVTAATLQVGSATNTGGIHVSQDVALGSGVVTLALETAGALTVGGGAGSAVVTGQNFALKAGSMSVGGAQAAAPSGFNGSGTLTLTTAGDLSLTGGNATGASASLVSSGNASLSVGGQLRIQGGAATGAAAFIDPQTTGATLAINAAGISLTGGSAQGAYAAISANGDIRLTLGSLPTFAPGTGVNTDAAIVANGANIYLNLACSGAAYPCAAQSGNPLLNTLTDFGWFGANFFPAGTSGLVNGAGAGIGNVGDAAVQSLLANLPAAAPQLAEPPKPREKGEVVVDDDGC
jgi:hypothetical protein